MQSLYKRCLFCVLVILDTFICGLFSNYPLEYDISVLAELNIKHEMESGVE